jgi:ankyrin repeat protein
VFTSSLQSAAAQPSVPLLKRRLSADQGQARRASLSMGEVPPPPENSPEEEQRLRELSELEQQAERLAEASYEGRIDDVLRLISEGAPTSFRTPDGESCLLLAAASGGYDVVRRLAEYDPALVNAARNDGNTPLMLAMECGFLLIADFLLNKTHKPDLAATRPSDGGNVLHIAAARNQALFATDILKKNPELAGRADRWGALPISIATECGNKEVVDILRPWVTQPTPLPLPSRPSATPRLCVMTGTGYKFDRGAVRVAAGGMRDHLRFVGGVKVGGADCLTWERFLEEARNPATAGTRWLVQAHGSEVNESDPRHRLEFSSESDRVPTTAVVRELVQNGVREMDFWCCHARQAADGLRSAMRDPLWPRIHGRPLRVVFHGEVTAKGSTAVNQGERQELIHALFHGDEAALRATTLATETIVSQDPLRGEVHVSSIAAPDLDEIARRLPGLNELQQGRLVRNFMLLCCLMDESTELAAAMKRFPLLADPNYIHKAALKTAPLIVWAIFVGNLEAVEVLLSDARTQLDARATDWSALEYAASWGQARIMEVLLKDSRTTKAHIETALEYARIAEHWDIVRTLEAALPP